MRLETNGRRNYSFRVWEKQFYNNLVTVLQEIELLRRETNGRRKKSFNCRMPECNTVLQSEDDLFEHEIQPNSHGNC